MRRHEFDPLSFVFGAVIAAIGIAFLTGHVDLTDLRLTWVWPIPIMVLGLLMLVSARRREQPRTEPADSKDSKDSDEETDAGTATHEADEARA